LLWRQQWQGQELKMDRTTSRRIFNEFSSEVDLNSPDGVIRSSEVDRYLENALKPLLEEGKAFKRVSINRRTGTRTTRYSYQGGKNIQGSINAILNDMHMALGYDVDPVTGYVKGTSAPPPMSITNVGRHTYNETRERILDPRTAASIKAQAIRVGGVSTTNKATGYTTTLVRAGLSGETRAMRALVDTTDRKYLAGELPSSALADGSSPATVEERTKAQVARQANIKDAREQAIADYIRLNPTSRLAYEEAAKAQKITDRQTKALLLLAERSPGTAEFKAAAGRRLDKRVANDTAAVEWAKRNRRNPVAKAILKNRRNKSFGGRLLNKSLATLRHTAVATFFTAITTAIGSMVKFLSGLPTIAANVHKLVSKGAQYNLPERLMHDYSALGAAIKGLNRETFTTALGSIHSRVSSIMNGDIDSAITKIAPMSALSGGRTINEIVKYFSNKTDNPDTVMRAAVNDVMKASFMQKTVQGDTETISGAFSRNMQDAEAGFSMGEMLTGLFKYWEDMSDAVEKNRIKEMTLAGEDFISLIAAKAKPPTDQEVAGTIQTGRMGEVTTVLERLKAVYEGIRDGILIKILSYMEPIAVWLRSLVKAVLGFLNDRKPLKGQFSEVLFTMNQEDKAENARKAEYAAAQIIVAQAQVNQMRERYGLTDDATREQAIQSYERSGVSPRSMDQVTAQKYFGAEYLLKTLKEKYNELKSDKATSGVYVVPGVTDLALGTEVYTYLAAASKEHADSIDKVISEYGTNSDTLKNVRYKTLVDLENTRALGSRTEYYESLSPVVQTPEGRLAAYQMEQERQHKIQRLEDLAAILEIIITQISNPIITEEAPPGVGGYIRTEVVAPGGSYDTDKYRNDQARTAREVSEENVIRAQVIDTIRARVGNEYINGIASGDIKVHIRMEADSREYSFTLKDSNGRELAPPITGISNRIQRDFVSNDLFNTVDITEAFSPVKF